MLVAMVVLACATAVTVSAAQGKKKHRLTSEQKELRKEMVEKYDTNKDGKLDKEERAKITKEDKEKMAKAGLIHKRGEKRANKQDNSQ